MNLKKWKIKDKIYSFPFNWNKDKVLQFANTDIKFCSNCGKIDVSLNHFDKCNPQEESLRQERIGDYYK